MSPIRYSAFVALILVLSGCIHTVTGPGYARTPIDAAAAAPTRVIYLGRHYSEPADFQSRLEGALTKAFASPVAVEYRPDIYQRPHSYQWPIGVEPPHPSQITVVIRAQTPFRCGTPAMAAAVFSVVTLGIVPFLDDDSLLWSTEIFSGPDARISMFPFEVRSNLYGWLPLLPFVPFNALWRAFRGDENTAFLRTYPSNLRLQISSGSDPGEGRLCEVNPNAKECVGDAGPRWPNWVTGQDNAEQAATCDGQGA